MLKHFQILTVTHQNLNIDEIARFAVSEDESNIQRKLEELKSSFNIEELSYTSTCNRVVYLIFRNEAFNPDEIISFFRVVNPSIEDHHCNQFVTHLVGEDAIRHHFEVASSIDSLVVGEREIFRQMRKAFDCSKAMGLTGDHLRLLDKVTVVSAKEVYAKTKIGEKPISIVSLAIKKLRQKNLDKNSRILLIGSGETNTLVGKFLAKDEFKNIVIFNRSLDNAAELSKMLNAPALHLSNLNNYSEGFDAMIVCTGANKAIINLDIYESLLNHEADKKLLIDLAVPRNIDADVVDKHELDYINIEQLRSLAEENLEFRKSEVVKAKIILEEKLKSFKLLHMQRQLELAMKSVPQDIRQFKEKALGSVYKKELDKLDDNAKNLVLEMMDYMEKKCVSVPMKAVKSLVV